MRKQLSGWHFHLKRRNPEQALARFLVGFEELRVRLAPSKYPNLEISDDGYLWFNVDSHVGNIEVLAFPFGVRGLKKPFIAVSIPRKAEEIDLQILEKLRKIPSNVAGVRLLADKRGATKDEILAAYKTDQHPPLAFTSDFDEIRCLKTKGVFVSYLGVRIPVSNKVVSEVESAIRGVVSSLENG